MSMFNDDFGREMEKWARDQFRKTFGRRLQDALYMRRMTQTDLAKKTRIPLQSINHYVLGNAMPSAYAVYKMAIVLEKPVGYFYG